MTVTNIAHAANQATSSATLTINSSGGDFIAFGLSGYQTTTTTAGEDSLGNSYTGLTEQTNASDPMARINYSQTAPSVSAVHTFAKTSVNHYPGLMVSVYSGIDQTTNYDGEQSGNSATGTAFDVGSVTPQADGALIYVIFSSNGTFSALTNLGANNVLDHTSTNYDLMHADEIQSGGPTARNAHITWNTSRSVACAAVFRAATGGGGGTRPVKMAGVWNGYAGMSGGFAN